MFDVANQFQPRSTKISNIILPKIVKNWNRECLPVVRIWSRKVWTLNYTAESSYLCVTNGVVLELEATPHVTAV